MTIKKLQNGSDIRGVALKIPGGEDVNLGKIEAVKIATAFAEWLKINVNKTFSEMKIAIGMDSRLTGPSLKKYSSETFASLGICVLDCGLASTPAMFMSTVFDEFSADGAIMITASHLPLNRNGFKFFTRKGGLSKKDISDILEISCTLRNSEMESTRKFDPSLITESNLMERYAKHLRELIVSGVGNGTKPLENMKILVDAGNGSGGFFPHNVLKPLGADISGSQFLEPDGTFPNHEPNPENKNAMESISDAVLKNNADLGIIFDTDVDRSSAVDRNGNPISRNSLIALASSMLAKGFPGTTIVTDSVTSTHLTDFIEGRLGLKHLRFKRGYKNVIDKSRQLNADGIDSQLAMETSGHGAFKENYFLDDGAYTAVKIIIEAAKLHGSGKSISSLIKDLKAPTEAEEIRIAINVDDFSSYGDTVLSRLLEWTNLKEDDGLSLETPNYEGVRINFDQGSGNGWALLRKSLHDPILPLNIESDDVGGVTAIKNLLRSFLIEFDKLDLTDL